jgi:hypothetical protein
VSYVVTAADLCSDVPGNEICKYADGTYLIKPASNAESREAELRNVESWVGANNLKLNRSKTTEIIFTNRRRHPSTTSWNSADKHYQNSWRHPYNMLYVSGGERTKRPNVLNSCSQTLYVLKHFALIDCRLLQCKTSTDLLLSHR